MKEYINREKLIKELECGIRAGNYEDGYEILTMWMIALTLLNILIKRIEKVVNCKDCKH